MSFDLENMPLDELRDLRKGVDRAIASYEDRKKKDALARLEEQAREMGYSLSELTGADGRKRKLRAKAAAKYANPTDPLQTWSGRGRRPHWVLEALDAGRDLSDLAI